MYNSNVMEEQSLQVVNQVPQQTEQGNTSVEPNEHNCYSAGTNT